MATNTLKSKIKSKKYFLAEKKMIYENLKKKFNDLQSLIERNKQDQT